MLCSILAIVLVLRLRKNSGRYVPFFKLCFLYKTALAVSFFLLRIISFCVCLLLLLAEKNKQTNNKSLILRLNIRSP